jgi:hypothetical protein
MDRFKFLENVDGPESFLKFVQALRDDRLADVGQPTGPFGRGASGWENDTIEDFLDAALSWARATEMGATQGLVDSSPWKRCAAFLYCGKIME